MKLHSRAVVIAIRKDLSLHASMDMTMSIETFRRDGIDTPVSRIRLGTWAISERLWGGADHAASFATIRRAIESGINLIDTAPAYGFCHSEEVVGTALQGMRGRAVIATKVALEWQDGKVCRNATTARIRTEVEDSLRRLRTDRIDVYQVHWPDPYVSHEETIQWPRVHGATAATSRMNEARTAAFQSSAIPFGVLDGSEGHAYGAEASEATPAKCSRPRRRPAVHPPQFAEALR